MKRTRETMYLKSIKTTFFKTFLTGFSCFLLLSCANNGPEEISYSGRALGTTFHVKYFDANGFDVEKGVDSIFQAINQSMSTYMEGSDISKINHGDTTVVVDEMFVEVFQASKMIYEQSNGYFDPTVGKLVNFYGFGPERFSLEIDSANIDSLMEYVGLDKIQLSSDNKIEKTFPGVYLDFNAIAKGYAVDRLGNYLAQNGIENYLVEVGGEILAKGTNLESQAPWKVGIDDPKQAQGKRILATIIGLKNRAMATSGNYRKFRIDSVTGEKYVHTIDPLTGYPAKNSLLSATVLAEKCMLADGYATALMSMGTDKAKEFLKKTPKIDAYLIYAQKDSVHYFMTEGFQRQLVEN